ncbi:MAG: hypothetical protein LBK02_09845 [Treponema sp.]|jgi:hypothetical protein|nr:hypothetical protein [Treponema sp.]
MNLPHEGALVLRQRSPWEAADAGLLLWRAGFMYFLPFFALPFWVCAFGLRLLPENIYRWSWLILWYLKPLFDRPILHIISVRFFESNSGTKRLLRGLGKALFRGLPGDLLWRRFSLLRSAVMPLRVLEKLRGKAVKKRKQELERGGLQFCSFLTIWGFSLEFVLLAGELLFSLLMIELVQEGYVSSPGDFFDKMEIFIFAAWCVNYMLVESLYVCMGFGLYINSRVALEGWDIEILFRKFTGARKKKRIFPKTLAVLLLAGCLLPFRLQAETALPAEPGEDAPLETLEGIFASDDFGGKREGWGIRFKKQAKEREPVDFNLAPWVQTIKQVFAHILRLAIILGIGSLGFFCIRYLYKKRGKKPPGPRGLKTGSRFPPGRQNPEALMAEAQALYERGDIRRAWRCCLAALFESWSRYRGTAFPPDATEYGCLALARASADAGAADSADGSGGEELETFASAITRGTALAYGGRLPPEGSFGEALVFCRSLGAGPAGKESVLPGTRKEDHDVQ